jgi:hypothetical protein
VANCTFSEFSHTPETFDLITLFHVLEHLEFPIEVSWLGMRSQWDRFLSKLSEGFQGEFGWLG